MATAFSTVLDLVYPRSCVGCGSPITGVNSPGHICWNCLAGMEIITRPFCSVCGDPVDGMIEHEYTCAWCQEQKPHFTMARSAVRYRNAVQSSIQALKYNRMMFAAHDLVPILAACCRAHYADKHVDCATFVPLHPRRERERSYNQSALLARGIARDLKIPLVTRCLKRIRDTSTQTALTSAQRRENVRGAFEACDRQWIEGRTVLLVDDVMTTGATVSECARILRKASAAHVYVATVARG